MVFGLAGCSASGDPASDFEYRAVAGGVEITKYIGTSIRANIPAKIEGEPVVAIGARAFEDSGIMEVTIPDSVTSIKQGAFSHCTGLISILIPKNVSSISTDAFAGCTGLENAVYKGVTYSVVEEMERREEERREEAHRRADEAGAGGMPTIAVGMSTADAPHLIPNLPQEFYDAINGN
ncbi:MAG: leucine-rich repeat domain-containing protein [Oscillospiraceae bacterium]|nr:leucine-rich repeat domain-containing protein [Oscillospiraceae bacterium]